MCTPLEFIIHTPNQDNPWGVSFDGDESLREASFFGYCKSVDNLDMGIELEFCTVVEVVIDTTIPAGTYNVPQIVGHSVY